MAALPDLTERFRASADDAGLVDVGYDLVDSAIGRLVLAATGEGLVLVTFADEDAAVARLAAAISPRVLRHPRRLAPAVRQLDDYLAGRRRSVDVPVDLQLAGSGFRRRVLEATRQVPFGRVRTYREIAAEAGNAAAVRAAGSALAANPVCVVVPCHRVLRTDGGLGGYAGGVEAKRRLLQLEGVA